MYELVGVIAFCALPAGSFYIWRRKNKRKQEKTPSIAPMDKVLLHGHDLSKWNYLGHTKCSYADEHGKTTSEYPIFLFADKKNDKRRSYYISGDSSGYVEQNHKYVNKYIKTWAAGEGEVYQRIQGADNCPSDYLKQYMLEHYNSEWDSSTNWWGTSDKAKYTAAQTKQKKERKAKEDTSDSESNVVSVNFGKQA